MKKLFNQKLFKLAVLLSFVLVASTSLSACISKEPAPLKSPCVGAEGSPCGAKRSANPEMFKV